MGLSVRTGDAKDLTHKPRHLLRVSPRGQRHCHFGGFIDFPASCVIFLNFNSYDFEGKLKNKSY